MNRPKTEPWSPGLLAYALPTWQMDTVIKRIIVWLFWDRFIKSIRAFYLKKLGAFNWKNKPKVHWIFKITPIDMVFFCENFCQIYPCTISIFFFKIQFLLLLCLAPTEWVAVCDLYLSPDSLLGECIYYLTLFWGSSNREHILNDWYEDERKMLGVLCTFTHLPATNANILIDSFILRIFLSQ